MIIDWGAFIAPFEDDVELYDKNDQTVGQGLLPLDLKSRGW